MPTITQQDYIYIDVPVIESGVESEWSNETIHKLYECTRNNTIFSVVLVREGYEKARVIYANPYGTELILGFPSMADGTIAFLEFDHDPLA